MKKIAALLLAALLLLSCFACAKPKANRTLVDALDREHEITYDNRERIIRDVYIENSKYFLADASAQKGVIVTWEFTWDDETDALLHADVKALDVRESKSFVKLTDKKKKTYYLEALGADVTKDTYVCIDKGAKDYKSGGYDMILFYDGGITSEILEKRILSGDGYAGTARFCSRAKTYAKSGKALADDTMFVTANLTARLDYKKDSIVYYTRDAVTTLFFNEKRTAYYKVIQPVEMYERDVIGTEYTRTADKPTVYNEKGKKVNVKGSSFTLPEAYGGMTVK
ncbi:MAG: hypothetical protein IKE65_05165 [Clostridia bacterium]|nr:hypothetical protein [Clostridia bacterium]